MVEIGKNQKYALIFIGEALFWALFLGLMYWLGFPGGGVFVAGIAVLNIILALAGWQLSKNESVPGFRTTMNQQLTEKQAYVQGRYMIPYEFGYRVSRVLDRGIDPAVSPSDDKEDAVRLFKLEFEPLNVSGKATLYIDLEQELSVDIEDTESLDAAVEEIQNVRLVKSWTTSDYEEKVQDVKESLGRSVDPTITRITEMDGGREIEKVPATIQNQSSSNNGSEESES